MKKLGFLFMAVLITGTTILMSCSKNSDTAQPPTIHFLAGAGLISADATVKSGAAISFGISATAATGKLNHFLVQRTFNGKVSTAYDSTFSTASYSVTISGNAAGSPGTESWLFTITDNNGNSAAVSVIITTTAAITYGDVTSYTNTILGSYNSTVGSSFASSNGTVYSLADAKANPTIIDWLYYYGATNYATIAAPDDADANTVFIGVNGLSTWSHRNATVFKKVTDAITWNTITNDSLVLIETQTGVTSTSITSLAVNDVLAFITEAGKKGLMKVTAITGLDDSGTITYDVKVQKTVK